MKRPLLGIDRGTCSLKAVRLLPSRRGISLDYAALVELPHQNGSPGEQDRVLALQSMLKSHDVRRCKSVINVFGKPPLIRYLTVPCMPKEELKEAIKWEAKKQMSLPIEDIVLDFLIVGEQVEGGQRLYEIVLVAAEKAVILNEIQETQRAGLRIAALDVGPLSLLNTVRLNYPKDLSQGLVFIDIGAGKTEINLARDGILRFTRTVQTGGNDLTASLQRELHLDYEDAEQLKRERGMNPSGEDISKSISHKRYLEVLKEALDRLILEVQRSLDYYRAQFRVEAARKIVLMGGTPLMPGFSDYFSSYFDAEVEVDDPFTEITCRSASFGDLRAMAPRFSSSVGLALRNILR
ncbi:MAG: type IV pilus assembly protein PilM [Nitrospiria bacterium]